MGFDFRVTLFFAVFYICAGLIVASEDVELKDPNLVVIATFAANNILKNAEEFGIQNTSSLHRIMDAHIVPILHGPQRVSTQYMLTIELGNNCTSEDTCSGGRHICETDVLDEPWNKKRVLVEDKTKCAEREPNTPVEFIETSSTIASSLLLDDAETKAIAEKAVTQMGDRRTGKQTLKHIGQARKVMMEETNSNLYYLTLYISTSDQDAINEVCEVTMEEALSNKEQTLQSLQCFTTGDNEGADKFGIARVPSEDLTPSLIRHAVLASLAIADAESLSQFQFKVIGYSLADARVSVDSGARDLKLKLGLVPTLCIKRSENEEEEEEEVKSCTIDVERDPSMCSITLTQWPWVADGYLFSDFGCEPTNYEVIGEELEAYTDDDASAAGEEGAEVEEVSSNAVQSASRRENVEEGEEEGVEEGVEDKEVAEEPFVARSAPCLGCPVNIDPNTEQVNEMANLALSALENAANSEKAQSIVRVVKATSQVVSGSLYVLTVELIDTNCIRGVNLDRSNCKPDVTEGRRRTCTVGIWDQPWLNSKQIRDPECASPIVKVETRSLKDAKAGVVTGTREFVTLSPDDEEVKDMATFALSRLDSFDDNTKKRLLDQVIDGTAHSVGRSKTFNMKMRVALADCPEATDASDPGCQASLQQSKQHFFCDVQVLAQPSGARFAPKRLVDSKCVPIQSVASLSASEGAKDLVGEGSELEQVSVQQHRNVLGGAKESADTASPYIQSIADFATSAINQKSNGNNLKFVRVVRAETQLVAGKKVILDVEVGFTNCTKADGAEAGTNCQLDSSQANVVCHVTVWDRVWLNDRRVTNMTCDSLSLSQEAAVSLNVATDSPSVGLVSVTSSPIVGGHVPTDTVSSEIEAYTDFALAVIEEQSNAEEKLKVSKILASSIQIVQGKNIRLSLEVGSTSCKKNQPVGDICIIDESKDFQICNIQIWDRAWLQEKQVTDLNCQPKRIKANERTGKSENFDESPFVGDVPSSFRLGSGVEMIPKSPRFRPKHDKQVNLPLLGGFSPVDPSDPTIMEMADFASVAISQSLNSDPSNSVPYKLAKIHAAEKQVVAGINYKMELELNRLEESLLCKVTVNDRSWVPERKVIKMKCFPQSFHSNVRKAKNGFSGYRPAAVNDAAVREAAAFAVSAMSKASPNTPFSLMKVKSSARQIGSKQVNYKLTMQLKKDNATVICDAVVAEKSARQLISSSCRNKSKRRRSVEGGYNPADINDAVVQKMADFATLAISQATDAGKLSVLRVISAETQVVSGRNYKLTLQTDGASGIQTCDVVVYDQSWTKTRRLTSFKCQNPSGSRKSRQVPVRPRRPGPLIRPNNSELSIQPPSQCIGGYCPIDPNEKAVKEMSRFATLSLSRSLNSGPLQLFNVRSAERQVVAGFNYRLHLEFNGARGMISCKIVVFDQAWTSTREITKSQCEEITPNVPVAPTLPVLATPVVGPVPVSSASPVQSPSVKPSPVQPSPVPVPISPILPSSAPSVSTVPASPIPSTAAPPLTPASDPIPGPSPAPAPSPSPVPSPGPALSPIPTPAPTSPTSTPSVPSAPAAPAPPAPPASPAPTVQPVSYISIDVESPIVKEMAEFAAAAISLPDEPLTLNEVVSAESQGNSEDKKYKLKIQVASETQDLNCDVIVFDQSSTKTRQLLSSNCYPLLEFYDPGGSEAFSSITARQFGAYFSVSPDDPEVVELALFATSQLSFSMNVGPLALETVESSSKQVLGGSNYKLNFKIKTVDDKLSACDVIVYKSSNTRQILYSQCVPVSRRKRSSDQLTGGISAMDTHDKKVQELTDFAVSTINLRSNEPNTPNAVHVLKASKQVVSGMMYTLELELNFVDCPQNTEACTRRQKCSVSIWEQPWLQKREVTKLSCKDFKKRTTATMKTSSRRQLLGGVTPADPASEEIQAHADFALQAIQAQSNARKLLGVVRIKNAATQTVSGKKIYLTMEVGETECPVSNKNNQSCSFDSQGERQLCKIEIWTRPWLKERQVTSLKCAVLGTNKPCSGKSCSKRVPRSTDINTPKQSHHHKQHHHAKVSKKSRKLKHMTAFRSYAKEFNKIYKTWQEFEHRYKIYRANQEKIELLNRHEMGTAVYGDTPFSDWSEAEYKAHLAGLRPSLRQSNARLPQAVIPQIDIPDEFDWRNSSVVTPVKNQGSCGSCWAFSVTGNVEGIYAVRNGELLSLSEQELVDCDKLDSGCNGGLPENAYKAIHELGGLEAETDYPYNGHQNTCKFNSNITRVQVTGGVEISSDETEMAKWLVQNGPISIGINANAMQYYRGGVSHPWKPLCRPGGIDHGVLIVGYGVSNYPKFNKTLPYWIVKNSWGTKWGEQGYYRVFRGDGTCGLNKMCTSATLD